MSFIEIKDLHKKYKDNVVLNGINLSIEKGNVRRKQMQEQQEVTQVS